jgi:hypothetical protein
MQDVWIDVSNSQDIQIESELDRTFLTLKLTDKHMYSEYYVSLQKA